MGYKEIINSIAQKGISVSNKKELLRLFKSMGDNEVNSALKEVHVQINLYKEIKQLELSHDNILYTLFLIFVTFIAGVLTALSSYTQSNNNILIALVIICVLFFILFLVRVWDNCRLKRTCLLEQDLKLQLF